MTQKEKTMLERIDMEAKMHIHAFCEIVPDQITGRKYAVVRKNCDGQIIHQYTNYYTPEQLKIAVSNYINGMWEERKNIKHEL